MAARSDAPDWLEAQFDRAVEIVQGLSKTGPIQTGYEEKLAMYSLYKQATVGDVPSARPPIWDVLGRAKWDAWAKHRGLLPREAKRLYVDQLQKVLRKYSGRTVARDLVRELDSYRAEDTDEALEEDEVRTSSSPSSGAVSPAPGFGFQDANNPNNALVHSASTEQWGELSRSNISGPGQTEEDEYAGDVLSQSARPMSSMSSALRYRTPMGGASVALPFSDRNASPPPIPVVQPLPRHATPSAYAHNASGSSHAVSSRTSIGYGPSAAPPASTYPPYPAPYQHFRQQTIPTASSVSGIPFPQATVPQRPPLERALESMQASLAALHERLESIESTGSGNRRSSPIGAGPRGPEDNERHWDLEGLGAWSLILTPCSKIMHVVQRTILLFFRNDAFRRSPLLAIVRRLFLDLSFLVFVIAVIRSAVKRSGVTRQDMRRIVLRLWAMVLGKQIRRRNLTDAAVQA